MHNHLQIPAIDKKYFESFIQFKDRNKWNLWYRNKYPVYRETSIEFEKNNSEVGQYIRIFSALIESSKVSKIKDWVPRDDWMLEFSTEGWNSYTSPEIKALVTVHKENKVPPRVISEFINHFWELKEKEDDIIHDLSGDKVIKKTLDEAGQSIYIDGRYLSDYLDYHDLCLVSCFFQGRQIKNPPHMALKSNNVKGNERNGKFELNWFTRDEGEKWQFWDSNYWWIGVIDPNEYDLSKKGEEKEIKESTYFKSKDGTKFSVLEADKEEHAIKGVFFNEGLLEKYKQNNDTTVERWSYQGGIIYWKEYHSVNFYFNENNEIYILAKDLQKIPTSEIGTWFDYNIIPEGSMPKEAWKNYFEAQFVDSKPPFKIIIDEFEELKEKLNQILKFEYISSEIKIKNELLQRPARKELDALLQVMNEYHKVFIETMGENTIESWLEENINKEEWKLIEDEGGIKGSKQGFFELIKYLEDEDFAEEVITPFNIIYDLRTYKGHRGAKNKKERALTDLGFDEEPEDYREVYDKFVRLFIKKLKQLNEEIDK
ncbi:MAG: hypothetical protein ACOC5T_00345 [Elusimicrobiota bacterium]